jgi:hypothetical protein
MMDFDSIVSFRISYIEIYNETMFDLLLTLPESWNQLNENQPMTICENEDGIYVKGLSCHLVQNEEEALNLLFEVSEIIIESRHDETNIVGLRPAWIQTSLRIRTV